MLCLRHRDVKAVVPSYASLKVTSRSNGFFLAEVGPVANVLERFGLHLRKVRTKVGISQEKLAELSGLHRTYVSSVERGKRNISLLNIDRMATAMNVSLRELMPTAGSR